MTQNLANPPTPFVEEQQRARIPTTAQINDRAIESIQQYANASSERISQRIEALNREWDTERILETIASTLSLTGLILGITVSINWLWLTALVLAFLLQHALQGWCPPLPIIRRLGARTRREIDREKYALKALRGDFSQIPSVGEAHTRACSVLTAVGIVE
jgi:hypothetical protein